MSRTLSALSALVLMSAAPAFAHGGEYTPTGGPSHGPYSQPHGPPATLSVKNTFDGEADVFVDGRFEGRVAGRQTLSVGVRAGSHEVRVSRPSTGFVLACTELRFFPGQAVLLPVDAPKVPMRVTNTGEVGLKLRADGAPSVWLPAGGTVALTVSAGDVDLHASIADPRGDWLAVDRVVWVEPGRPNGASIRGEANAVVVVNRDRFPVHALLDGADLGWIGAGETERVFVRPGPAELVLLDKSGRVRTATSVVTTRGNEATVVVSARPMPARPGPGPGAVVVVSGGGRPPPSRPATIDGYATTVTYAPCHGERGAPERPGYANGGERGDRPWDDGDRSYHAYVAND